MVKPSEEITHAFRVLSDGRRRFVLYLLAHEDPPVTVESLAARVGAQETDTTPDAVDEATLEQVRADLYHVHLPMLANHGFIDFDATPGEITVVSDIDALQPYMGTAQWSEFSGVAATGQR